MIPTSEDYERVIIAQSKQINETIDSHNRTVKELVNNFHAAAKENELNKKHLKLAENALAYKEKEIEKQKTIINYLETKLGVKND